MPRACRDLGPEPFALDPPSVRPHPWAPGHWSRAAGPAAPPRGPGGARGSGTCGTPRPLSGPLRWASTGPTVRRTMPFARRAPDATHAPRSGGRVCPLCTPSRRRRATTSAGRSSRPGCDAWAIGPQALIEALHAAQEAFGFLDDGRPRLRRRHPGRAPFARLRRGDVLLVLHPQAAGRAHVRRVHGNGLLHQRRQGDPRRPRPRASASSRSETTPDGKVSLLTARCLGACSLAPGGDRRRRRPGQGERERPGRPAGGDVSEMPVAARPDPPPRDHRAKPTRARRARHAYVCEAASCMSAQAHDITLRLGEPVAEAGLDRRRRSSASAASACAPPARWSRSPRRASCSSTSSPTTSRPSSKALKTVKPTDERQPQGPFFEKQLRVATENFGRIDPESLDDYLAQRRLPRPCARPCPTMTSAEVLDEIMRSGLRGRGGAGYPDRPEVDHRRQGPGQRRST